MINYDVKFDTNQKSETEEVGKCCEKVYSHLKHSVNIPLWTATLTFTPQRWGVNDMSPKSVLFTPPTVYAPILLWAEVQTHSRVSIRFLGGVYMMEYCHLGVIQDGLPSEPV